MTTQCKCQPCNCGPSCRCASCSCKTACACGAKGGCGCAVQAKAK